MRNARHSLPKIAFLNWKKEVDELCKRTGMPLIIEKYDDVYWLKRFHNRETPGDIILEWNTLGQS